MRLIASEYSRGLLSWTAVEGLRIAIGTAPSAGGDMQWSDPLADAGGAVVPIDLGPVMSYRLEMNGSDPIDLRKFWIRLERVQEGVVITRYWHGLPKTPVVLRHVPDYGTYHRLVVDAGTLDWGEDLVFREQGILVRFVTGTIEGEEVGQLKAVSTPEGKPTLEGSQATVNATGRFIEVVTPGRSPEQAELHAYSTLGLLALALGQNVLGRVIFTEPWIATPREQAGEAVATGAAFPRKAEKSEFDRLDALLDKLTRDGQVERARVISLRWYERGLRAVEPLDMLLSFFIGIETLVAAFAKISTPLPVEQERSEQDDAILKLIKPLGEKVIARVSQRIRGASIREQFAFYAERRKLGAAESSRFDKTKKIRDSAVHGDPVDVTVEVAHEAE